MRTYLTSFLYLAFLLMLSACSQETFHPVTVETTLSAEGPVFEGANTLQGNVPANFHILEQSMHIGKDHLKGAMLKTVTLSVDDSTNLDQFSSITLQFVSENTDMIKVALINPVPKGQHKIELTVASEQENLAELFKQEKFTVVADAILNKDSEANIKLKAHLEFQLTIKK